MKHTSKRTVSLRDAKQQEPIDDDITLDITETEPHLVDCNTAIAQCRYVERFTFHSFGSRRERLIFGFVVIEPQRFEGVKLKMFAEFKSTWKYLPSASKLRKLVLVAGVRPAVGSKLAFRKLFVGKIFECALKHVAGERTVILMLRRKVAG